MARIVSKSKSKSKYYKGVAWTRLILIGSMVMVILLMAFMLYETDKVLFRTKYAKLQYDTTKKNMNHHRHNQQQQVYVGPDVIFSKKNSIRAAVEQGDDNKEAAQPPSDDEKQDDGTSPEITENESGNTKEEGEVGTDDEGETDAVDTSRRRVAFDLENLRDGGRGTIVIETINEWAPIGVERFWELIENEFYVQCRMFRVVPKFVAQFGIAATPEKHAQWNHLPILDDPVTRPNLQNTITFAMSGKNTRTTQMFLNLKDNTYLDREGFAPFGMIVEGQEFLPQINDEYKEQPNQGKIIHSGNVYLDEEFPNLTYISAVRILDGNQDDQSTEGDDAKDDEKSKGDDKKGEEEEESAE